MDRCDVLIAGGGPAGSACAWALRRSGLDAVILDSATFPRDKVCAGWITPQVVSELQIDLDEYGRGRTLQPITGFRTGFIDQTKTVDTAYSRPVSYGIRRCEFDHFLVERSGARLIAGTPVTSIQRRAGEWVVNGTITAPMLVGAGGHFCPVARYVNGRLADDRLPLVVAQEAEFRSGEPPSDADPGRPELYFCRDLKGYGWCFRKQDYLNVGIGRLDRHSLPRATAEFVRFLVAQRRLLADGSWRWRGHAYLLHQSPRRIVDDGVVLVGDAAGLAYPESGEGIRPAVESGLIAASVIANADARYARDHLEPYSARLRTRFGGASRDWASALGSIGEQLASAAAVRLLEMPWFVRRVVIDRWFLHAQQAPLAV